MTGNPIAGIVADKLVSAYDLVSTGSFIICDIVDSGNEPTKDKLDILRDYLMDAESALSDVIVSLVGHTLAEVE